MNILSGLKLISAAALIAFGAGVAAQAQTAFAPVAVVNDEPITYYDVDQRARLLRLTGAPENADLGNAAFEQLVDDTLRGQAGERFQIGVSETELADARVEFSGRFNINEFELDARMRRFGVDDSALDRFLKSQVSWRELVNRRFGSRATPSEVELDQEIALAASAQAKSYRLSEIGVPAGRGQEAQARALIDRIRAELSRGASFAALARRYSRTPTAKRGGDVGWVPETVLPPELAEVIRNTPPGQATQPIAAAGGISIYLVADTRNESPPWARDATMTLTRISVPVSGDEGEAMDRAEQIRRDSQGCGSIPDITGVATRNSIDNKLVSALPGPVQGAVRLLQAGQASEPVRNADSVEIFIVCDRSGGVDDEARNQLREQIRNDRLSRLADSYLQELRREAVIERR